MRHYIPNTPEQKMKMLEEIGIKDVSELFSSIPDNVKLEGSLKLPDALDELELVGHMKTLAGRNINTEENICFLGAGAYDHFIPSAVNHILSREEFYTSYTPYQAEMSQGTLQAMFEYQTMICELTGMDVSNASMYDGATAMAEAACLCCGNSGKNGILISKSVNPQYRHVLKTYARFRNYDVQEIELREGRTDLADLEAKLSGNTAAVLVQNPNFFGLVEDLENAAIITHKTKALLTACVDPISLAVLKPPGEAGADIAVGDGQSLGNPLSFGGPYLGFFAAKKGLIRKMPGRIVGMTNDASGRRGFVLTLQAREQHIRREKATSNICTNHALNALAATVYLTLLGKKGLKQVANACLQKSHYAFDVITATGAAKPLFNAPFFKEFPLKIDMPAARLNEKLLKDGIIGGYDLEKDYPEYEGGWMIAVTEKRSKEHIDKLAESVSSAVSGWLNKEIGGGGDQ